MYRFVYPVVTAMEVSGTCSRTRLCQGILGPRAVEELCCFPGTRTVVVPESEKDETGLRTRVDEKPYQRSLLFRDSFVAPGMEKLNRNGSLATFKA